MVESEPLRIIAIAAMDEGRVIGAKNALPWHIPEDMKRMSALTRGHAVLMGRKTYQSLPDKFRPLPGRRNIVITRSPELLAGEAGIEIHSSPCGFIEAVKKGEIKLETEKLWVFGGEEIYKATLQYWDEVCLTFVKGKHDGDAFFPEFEDSFIVSKREDFPTHSFLTYTKNP